MENVRIINYLFEGEIIEVPAGNGDSVTEVMHGGNKHEGCSKFYVYPQCNIKSKKDKSIIDIIKQEDGIKDANEDTWTKETNYCEWRQTGSDSFLYICYYEYFKDEGGLCNTLEVQSLSLPQLAPFKKKLLSKLIFKVQTPINKVEEKLVGDTLETRISFHRDFDYNSVTLGLSNAYSQCIKKNMVNSCMVYCFLIPDLPKGVLEYVLSGDSFLYRFKGRVRHHPNVLISYEIVENRIHLLFKQANKSNYTVNLSSDHYLLSHHSIPLCREIQSETVVYREINENIHECLICVVRFDDYAFYVYR